MKRIALVAVGVVVVLIAIVLIGGALMPRDHVAASAIRIGQPADSVWAVVRNVAGTAAWWDRVERVERMADASGREVWTHHTTTGPLTIAVESEDPPRRLVTRIVADESAPFGGTWTYELAPGGGGTRVTVTEDGYINNLVFRFLANTIIGVHGTADSYLGSLARRFGEQAEPEHVRPPPN